MPKQPAPSLMGRALRYLSRREHSQQELRKKLLPFAESEQELADLLLKLEKQGWLSNERFAEGLARRKSDRYGSLKIVDELKQNGIDPETISRIVMPNELGSCGIENFQLLLKIKKSEPNKFAI